MASEIVKKGGCCLMPEWVTKNCLSILIVVATILGFAFGLVLRLLELSDDTIVLIGFPGKLILRAFFMIILLILVCSMILGVSAISIKENVRMVLLTIAFFLIMSLLCSILGAATMQITGIGKQQQRDQSLSSWKQENLESGSRSITAGTTILDSFLDLLRNSIPDNIIKATMMQEYTAVEPVHGNQVELDSSFNNSSQNGSASSSNKTTSIKLKKVIKTKLKENYFGLLVFSVLVGCAMSALGDEVKHLRLVIKQLDLVMMKIMGFLIRTLPVALFFWMCQQALEVKSLETMFSQVAWLVVAGTCLITLHHFVILPLLYVLFVRKNPFRFHMNLIPVILMAFGTVSSSATLPVTLKCMEEKNKGHLGVTRFVLPFGSVVNMQGSSIYHTMCTFFVAFMNGETVGFPKTVIICLTVVLIVVAAPGVNSGGQPTILLTVLAVIGTEPTGAVGLVVIVDWIMDRLRTADNVVSDCYVAAFVEKLCWKELYHFGSDGRDNSVGHDEGEAVAISSDSEATGCNLNGKSIESEHHEDCNV